MNDVMDQLRSRDGWTCHYCGIELVELHEWGEYPIGAETLDAYRAHQQRSATIDHRTPRIRGGSHQPWNLVLACRLCNSRKGTKPYLDYVFIVWAEQDAA